ncbi:MAG TPA: M14 family zinc carboxypeptidase [Lentibacillus sp.]|uniref:FIMAH domain-containing protein n=1 Tax=Lentibacillus sp. TaxID=1925746 RepID=UPI002B4ADE03|nr:M14 family zinc carboxypeptidase [Lentibacillus sp.]HLR63447.1 M14 family zinc carboxypeptidase [Lentibacillus sp.]
MYSIKKPLLNMLFFAFMLAITSIMSVSETVHAKGTPYNPVPYEDIYSILEQHEEESDRVSVEVIGQSALGHDLYSVVISEPEDDLEEIKEKREEMIANPEDAKDFIEEHPDFKVPFMVNGSIHGDEYPGVDAVLKLIDRFAYDDDETTEHILDNNILVFNVVNNPDGRILGTRRNGEGFDLNRDHVTLSQPEAAANVDLITEWNPMVFLDLHGFVKRSDDYPGLIEPTTGPHNPSYEHDLYLEYALEQAKAMEGELVENKQDFETNLYQNMKGTHIPYRDAEGGWDDYPPIFTPMYAMLHGAYGHTLETPTNSVDGVKWHVNAVMGALKFASDNKIDMTKNQLEVFRRGIQFDHPEHEDGFFPKAYVLPVDETDPTTTEKAVNNLLRHDVEVKKAESPFSVDGEQYDEGTFIVPLDQPKASLANTLLWDGEDISDQASAMYDISAWNLPELWGFAATPTDSSIDVPVEEAEKLDIEGELIGEGPYEIMNSSVEAVALVNELIQNDLPVYKAENGHYYVENGNGDVLAQAVEESGITVKTTSIPENATELTKVDVAVLKDGGQHGIRTALEQLGFKVDEMEPQAISENGLDGYDVLVANGPGMDDSDMYKQNIQSFIADGGKYIAIGARASNKAADLGLTDANINTGARNSNGVVSVNYKHTSLTSGYDEQDIGFVYNPVWYTNIENDRVIASFADQDFFKAGFWKNSESAQGQPVILKGKQQGVTLLGLEVGFRAHPEYLYRMLSNTIYPGEETILTTASGMKARVERYESDGEFDDSSAVRSLSVHLTAVSRYEEQGAADKVIKHVEGFKDLLDHQQEDELISEKAFNILKNDADALIEKWQ